MRAREPREPAEREGWVKNRSVSWTWYHPATGGSVFLRSTLRGGYWLAYHPRLRPYAWNDGILRGERGARRRFKSAESAMLAVESVS